MNRILLPLVLAAASAYEPPLDGKAVFALLQRYHAAVQDVSFLYEGRVTQLARTAGVDPDPLNPVQFQGLYAYRSDGATVMDVFSRKRGDTPNSRRTSTLLRGRVELLDASPDTLPPGMRLRDVKPATMYGGPGSLSRPDSPELMFLLFFSPHPHRSLGPRAPNHWTGIGGRASLPPREDAHISPLDAAGRSGAVPLPGALDGPGTGRLSAPH